MYDPINGYDMRSLTDWIDIVTDDGDYRAIVCVDGACTTETVAHNDSIIHEVTFPSDYLGRASRDRAALRDYVKAMLGSVMYAHRAGRKIEIEH